MQIHVLMNGLIRSLILILSLTSLSLASEAEPTIEPINIGEMRTLYSNKLQEERQIQIALPASYNEYDAQTYPVLYLLDGESNFQYLSGLMSRLTRAPYPSMPEMIIVGIINTDRTRDLTPSVVTTDSVQVEMQSRVGEKNGGNPAFFVFLEDELMPMIEKNFRTNDFKMMIGHSFGGITALNHLINGSKKMNAYIVHDPSIWWDSGEMLKRYEALNNSELQRTRLFLTQAGSGAATSDKQDHYGNISHFSQYLSGNPITGLDTTFMAYPEEDHGSVVLVGNIDGLRTIFADIRINIKSLPENPYLIQEQYQHLSEQFGLKMVPSEPYLVAVMSYLQRIKRADLVKVMEDYAVDLYPHGNIARGVALHK